MSDEKEEKTQSKGGGDNRVNLRVLAGYINVTEQRVLQLCQAGVIPRGKDRLVNLRDGVSSYIENIKSKEVSRVQDESTGLDFKNYAERDNYYKSEDRRISLLEKIGELVPKDEVEEEFYDLIEMCREAYLILPDVLEREADLTRKQTGVVQKFTDKKLQSLASTESKRARK